MDLHPAKLPANYHPLEEYRVNAAFLIMSSVALTGADPAPATPAPVAPVVINGGAGCSPCGAPACCESSRPNLWDRLKARLATKKSRSCCSTSCAPACPPVCAPKPPPPPCVQACKPCPTTCEPTCSKPGLFDRLKWWWGSKKHRNGPCCDPCGGIHLAPTTPGTMPAPGTPPAPKEMPKPKTTNSTPQQLPETSLGYRPY